MYATYVLPKGADRRGRDATRFNYCVKVLMGAMLCLAYYYVLRLLFYYCYTS